MSNEKIIMILQIVIFAATLLSIIYAVGVVWRVEEELDVSYKLLLAAIIFFAAEEFVQVLQGYDAGKFTVLIVALKTVFALLFLAGTYAMRDLVRRMDGEKQ